MGPSGYAGTAGSRPHGRPPTCPRQRCARETAAEGLKLRCGNRTQAGLLAYQVGLITH